MVSHCRTTEVIHVRVDVTHSISDVPPPLVRGDEYLWQACRCLSAVLAVRIYFQVHMYISRVIDAKKNDGQSRRMKINAKREREQVR